MATKIKSATAYVDYEEFEGDTLEMSFTWKDSAGDVIDISAYTAAMDIKASSADVTSLLTLTNGSGITLAATSPNLLVTVTNVQTATLGKGKYVYDIELTEPSGKVNTLISGVIVLIRSVTQ
jgi:hypothetical protein